MSAIITEASIQFIRKVWQPALDPLLLGKIDPPVTMLELANAVKQDCKLHSLTVHGGFAIAYVSRWL